LSIKKYKEKNRADNKQKNLGEEEFAKFYVKNFPSVFFQSGF
jgi:hypothetical protein